MAAYANAKAHRLSVQALYRAKARVGFIVRFDPAIAYNGQSVSVGRVRNSS